MTAQNDTLWQILRGIWTPQPVGTDVIESDAPGTSERDHRREGNVDADQIAPRTQVPNIPMPYPRPQRREGPGGSGILGYRDHGDAVRIASRIGEQRNNTRARFPELATHGRPFVPPEFNIIYDILKSRDAYDKVALATAHGSITVNTTTQTLPVTLDTPGGLGVTPLSHYQLLGQFPGALQMLPVLMAFSFGQTVTTATGEISLVFVPQGGDIQYPLGEYFAGTGQSYNTMRHILKAPITDPGQINMGNIVYTPNTVAGTPGTLFWRMLFGFALLLPAPAFKAPEPLQVGQWIVAAPEPPLQEVPGTLLQPEGPITHTLRQP